MMMRQITQCCRTGTNLKFDNGHGREYLAIPGDLPARPGPLAPVPRRRCCPGSAQPTGRPVDSASLPVSRWQGLSHRHSSVTRIRQVGASGLSRSAWIGPITGPASSRQAGSRPCQPVNVTVAAARVARLGSSGLVAHRTVTAAAAEPPFTEAPSHWHESSP
jgi:hypothetical protein